MVSSTPDTTPGLIRNGERYVGDHLVAHFADGPDGTRVSHPGWVNADTPVAWAYSVPTPVACPDCRTRMEMVAVYVTGGRYSLLWEFQCFSDNDCNTTIHFPATDFGDPS